MPETSHARPAELRADAARNRTAVLDAARTRLTAGDDSLPMNLLAKEAGVGVGTVYRQFPNRQVLLETLAIDTFERLSVVAEEAAHDPDVVAGLNRLFSAVVTAELEDPSLAAVLASDSFRCHETTAAGRALLTAATVLLDRGLAEGLIAPETEPPDLRNLLLGAAHAVRLSGDQTSVDRYVAVLVRGLRPVRDNGSM